MAHCSRTCWALRVSITKAWRGWNGGTMPSSAESEDILSSDDLVYGEDGKYVVEKTVVHDHHKHGWMTFAEVLHKSSNIGIIKVGQRLGPDRLAKYVTAFGFGQKTDVDLHGEVRGLTKQ